MLMPLEVYEQMAVKPTDHRFQITSSLSCAFLINGSYYIYLQILYKIRTNCLGYTENVDFNFSYYSMWLLNPNKGESSYD
jgi:hypothetical protein